MAIQQPIGVQSAAVHASLGHYGIKADDDVEPDYDIEVVKSLARLAGGDLAGFADQTQPPAAVAAWINQTDPREACGLLCAALRRWHVVRR
ncbi:MAG: hypothetical protein AAF589_09415 [Planctomycetota bacterium]